MLPDVIERHDSAFHGEARTGIPGDEVAGNFHHAVEIETVAQAGVGHGKEAIVDPDEGRPAVFRGGPDPWTQPRSIGQKIDQPILVGIGLGSGVGLSGGEPYALEGAPTGGSGRQTGHADVVEHRRVERVVLVRGHGQSEQNRGGHTEGHRMGVAPTESVVRLPAGEGVAAAHDAQPQRRVAPAELMIGGAAARRTAPLQAGASTLRGDEQGDIPGARRMGLADHQSGFGPVVRIGHAGQAGGDDKVAAQILGDKMASIGRLPNIRARSL